MALRVLQFCIVFTVGLWTGPVAGSGGAKVGGEGVLSLVVSDPEDVISGRGQSATLRCSLNYTQSPHTITWRQNQQPLPNDTRRQVREDGTLYIHKVAGKQVSSVEGNYSCLVRNSIGAILTNAARLKVAMLAKHFSDEPIDVIVETNQPVRLSCLIQSVPEATIHWQRHGNRLPQNNRYVPLPSGDLLIISAQISDAGSYRCTAWNSVLKKNRISETGNLTVLEMPNEPHAPKILPLYRNQTFTVHVTSNLTLYCAAFGWPRPNIVWTRNKNVISNSSVLRINNITTSFTGTYNCSAGNSIGSDTQMYNIMVVEAPYFIETPKSLWFPSARAARIWCKAGGIPEPVVTWLKDGVPLVLNERIRWSNNTLSFSHTYTTDQGLYQCVAENKYGRIWTAAQLTVNKSDDMPRPPSNLRCYSYNTSSICLQWDSPTNINVSAYTIHSRDIELYRYSVTNNTYFFISGLQLNKSYAFYVRAYATAASDNSHTITCQTAVSADRNLRVKDVGATMLKVEWSTLHSDIPCSGDRSYKLQWRRTGHLSNNADVVSDNYYVIKNLKPSESYEIRVQTSSSEEEDLPWTEYTMPNIPANTNVDIDTNPAKLIPSYLEAEPVSPHSVNLTWTDVRPPSDNLSGYYMVCYVAVRHPETCETSNNFAKSTRSNIVIKGLNPFTLYEFKVRYHNLDGRYGTFSHAVECKTLENVPEPVTGLIAKLVNDTTVCLRWMVPKANGRLLNYVISYAQKNVSLELWPHVKISASEAAAQSCLRASSDAVSVPLSSLSPGRKYLIVVRASTNVGLSPPSKYIHVETSQSATTAGPYLPTELPQPPNQTNHKPELGIIVGVSIALICIVGCISCMVFRRRCLKARALERARAYAPRSANGEGDGGAVPATVAAATLDSCRPLASDRRCVAEAHELQRLVADDATVHAPPAAHSHIDTKGGVGYPNGQLNGLKYIANGHIPNGTVHITENPQYEQYECNGNYNMNSESHNLLNLEGKRHPDNSLNDDDDILNTTQLTNLDESVALCAVHSAQPVLGPNG